MLGEVQTGHRRRCVSRGLSESWWAAASGVLAGSWALELAISNGIRVQCAGRIEG